MLFSTSSEGHLVRFVSLDIGSCHTLNPVTQTSHDTAHESTHVLLSLLRNKTRTKMCNKDMPCT